ncbi:hypothetical protein [Kitasatospora sp. NPDC050543]|uniref:hypothetical protein n=1 Tax=Kitasatospora sp. NPDC050543 TaxID=3364054 RepID=UPI0037BA1040
MNPLESWWAFPDDKPDEVEAIRERRPTLTPEEHVDRPLPPEDRKRRASLLERIREINRQARTRW